MRIAAIDIGTNSVHMIVVRVRPDLSFEVIDREKFMVRLGAGGLDGRALTAEAMTAALQALSTFRRLADSHGVDEILAVATSATREAGNGGEFLARIERETGIRPMVITGAEEARLIHQAAVYGVDVGSARAVVIDIGGGSVEITLGTGTSIQLARSFKIGVIRLTERFVKTDPISERDERRLEKHVLDEIDRHCEQIAAIGFDRVIGTSGTILSLGTVAATEARGSAPAELRNLRVSAKQIRRVRKEVCETDLEQRLAMPGLDPRRADIVVGGAVLLDTILRRLEAEELTLCDLALREGLVLDYVRRHKRQIAQADRIPDVRRRSTIELAERCNYYAVHAQQVARLALALFDQTRALHGLTDREREWLEYASLMHDLGVHISYTQPPPAFVLPDQERRPARASNRRRSRSWRWSRAITAAARRRRRTRSTRSSGRRCDGRYGCWRRSCGSPKASTAATRRSCRRSSCTIAGKTCCWSCGRRATPSSKLWAAQRHVEPFEELMEKPIRLALQQPGKAETAPRRRTSGSRTVSS